jgi:hypothetical protein
MRLATLTLSAMLIAAATAPASDDLTIVSTNTLNGKPGGTSTSYLASDHVRMAQDGGHEFIIDLKTGVTTTLDGAKKTYYTTTKQDMEQFAAKMQERMNDPQMKKGMEMMGKMSEGMAGPIEVTKTGETRSVAGFRCDEWVITMNAFTTMKECVTSELQYPAHAFEAYKEYSESMKKMMSGFGTMAQSGAELADKMKAMKGYPVATSMKMDVMGQKTTSESQVVEVRKGAIPASTWEVPAGYTKVDNPMLKAFEGHGRRRN